MRRAVFFNLTQIQMSVDAVTSVRPCRRGHRKAVHDAWQHCALFAWPVRRRTGDQVDRTAIDRRATFRLTHGITEHPRRRTPPPGSAAHRTVERKGGLSRRWLTSLTTHRWPACAKRRTKPAPIRPNPIMPKCILNLLNCAEPTLPEARTPRAHRHPPPA